MRYQGVFFDFDYTLGDPTPAIVRGYQMGFQALGLEPPTEAQVRPTIGPTLFDGYTHLSGDRDEAHRQAGVLPPVSACRGHAGWSCK